MIEGIGIALKAHYDTANGAKNILESAITQINNNYIGAMLAEKTKEAKEIYNSTLADSRQTNYEACIAILDEVANQAKKVVEQPVSPDFISTLEAMKNVKDKTPKEIESVVGTYRNNYWAYRAICTFLGGSLKGFNVVTLDEILDAVDELKKTIHDCFFKYNVSEDGYQYRNVMTGELLPDYDKAFVAFIDGRFEDATNSMKKKDEGIDAEKLNNNG